MDTIDYKDIQYQRELDFYQKLAPVLEKLKKQYADYIQKTEQQEKMFLRHLSSSIRIDRFRKVCVIIDSLNSHLQTNFHIDLFLFQAPLSNAMCIPRYVPGSTQTNQELMILVSQHFLNELSKDEQVCVLAHELAHLLFGHVHVPGKMLLDIQNPLAKTDTLKSLALKWMICSEISCDLFSFLACNQNIEAFCSTLVKYTTGLNQQAISIVNQNHELRDFLLAQYDDIVSARYDPMLTTHPLTPLRLKIVQSISQAKLVQHYGKIVPPEQKREYRQKFTRLIDNEVRRIYPELLDDGEFNGQDILLDMCLAVALSDGRLEKAEIAAIIRIIGSQKNPVQLHLNIAEKMRLCGPGNLVQKIVEKSVRETKTKNLDRGSLLRILRQCLVVAMSDGCVQSCELKTIFDYAQKFGFTKPMIAAVLEQMKPS